jgi:hypothetical protein
MRVSARRRSRRLHEVRVAPHPASEQWLTALRPSFGFTDDVIAREETGRLVAGQLHGNALRNPGTNQVAGRRPPAGCFTSAGGQQLHLTKTRHNLDPPKTTPP